MAKKVAAITIGCKVNLYDTQTLLQKFVDTGYDVTENAAEAADVIIVNTCCVTNAADKKSRQAVRRAKSRGAIVAVMGCASQATPEKYADIGADIVLGTTDRSKILDYVTNFRADNGIIIHSPDILTHSDFETADITKMLGKTRAFLKIQDGCDNFCAFCIIPHVRGPSRSRPYGDVVAQARRFVQTGHKEIVIAGICVASYGKDIQGHNILSVLRAICEIDGIRRVRLSSVEPNVITPDFVDFAASQPKFCDHLHLSLQSGSDAMLAAMNRRYTAAQYADAVTTLRKIMPNVSITTDIIAGFPGESEDDHRQTMDFIEKLGLSALHVFPFSAKEGTAAAKMANQLPGDVKNRRAKEMISLGDTLTAAHYGRFTGKTMPVLVEGRNAAGLYEGKTTNYINVCFEAPDGLEGSIVDVRLDVPHADGLFGISI
ncbi:MAG: tRNA (N(6)-L-threonylcarbamoyladenosine(37)-C(2))-methylthiotransferase MtaB [Defluviitaleaceae bacterium]|nr:tRNA (N(6)-L-threonylcarbamoyladenosine(37)-C(2))-methylthiotransferase MtaB [Defluviitaleaceae bacterium]